MRAVIKGIVLMLLVVSCAKDDSLEQRLDASNELLSALAVYNGVLATNNIEVFLDDRPLNTTTERVRLGNVLAHLTVIPGERILSSTFHSRRSSFQSEQSKFLFEPGKFYSLFLYGRGQFDLKHKLVEDNLIQPASGRFKVRFANFRLGSESVKFTLMVGNEKRTQTVDVSGITNFLEFDRTADNITIMVEGLGRDYDEGYTKEFVPQDQAVYTIWTWGASRTQHSPSDDDSTIEEGANGTVRPVDAPVTITAH